MTKYALDVDEQYKALATITLGEKNFSGDQPFDCVIESDRVGRAFVTNGQVEPGSGMLTGNIEIKGVTAEFRAKVDGKNITGTIKYRLLFLSRQSTFEGIETT